MTFLSQGINVELANQAMEFLVLLGQEAHSDRLVDEADSLILEFGENLILGSIKVGDGSFQIIGFERVYSCLNNIHLIFVDGLAHGWVQV